MKKFLLAGLALTLLTTGVFAQDEVSDADLLQTMDDARFVDATTFTFTSEVVAERPDGTSRAVVQLYFKENADGESLSRIEFLEPEDMAGEVFVNTPEGTFLWNPDLFEPLKVSDRQEVFGDASVAETAGVRFNNGDYAIASREAVTLDDGTAAIKVTLEATGPEVAFQSVSVNVDPDTLQPLDMTLFALGGEPINKVTFETYGDLNGDAYAEQQLIESLFVEGNKTLLTITSIEAGELSDDLFNPDLLGS
jgi:hypothetical protein